MFRRRRSAGLNRTAGKVKAGWRTGRPPPKPAGRTRTRTGRRKPSRLGEVQPAGWLAEYTTELLNVLHVLGRLVALEPRQADLLARVCAGPTLTAAELTAGGVRGGTAVPTGDDGRPALF
jgi:hypothetical protein